MSEKDPVMQVLEGVELQGRINVEDDTLRNQISKSIRLNYPQVWAQPNKYDRICLVGGGPSLDSTFDELRELVFAGAKLVTMNGAYQWCLERNLKPSAQIVLDARANNAGFLTPEVPGCRYYLASQCHTDTWAAVEGYEHVGIFHAWGGEDDIKMVLDKHYLGNWTPITGGTTVAMRSLALLRTLGYVRYDIFGVDSCHLEGKHHAYSQPQNDADRKFTFNVAPTGHPELGRQFVCSPWHAKQLEDFLQLIRVNGHHFRINVHGDGLLAFALSSSADLEIRESE